MEAERVAHSKAAAISLAGALGLRADDAAVLHNANKVALRLLPCDVFARVAPADHHGVAALEVELARQLAALASPIAILESRVEPRVYEVDGFAISLWTHYETVTAGELPPGEYADALRRLHRRMRSVEVATPHLVERVAAAERLVANEDESPALADADRQLLVTTLQSARQQIQGLGAAEQLLHGDPHPGNVLNTQDGPLFIDLETCCRGPVEFDVAHLPDEAIAHYPGVDPVLVGTCRRLVLAMVAAWRWDVRDEFPNGHQHGRDILALLREGPPWPVLGTLVTE